MSVCSVLKPSSNDTADWAKEDDGKDEGVCAKQIGIALQLSIIQVTNLVQPSCNTRRSTEAFKWLPLTL